MKKKIKLLGKALSSSRHVHPITEAQFEKINPMAARIARGAVGKCLYRDVGIILISHDEKEHGPYLFPHVVDGGYLKAW